MSLKSSFKQLKTRFLSEVSRWRVTAWFLVQTSDYFVHFCLFLSFFVFFFFFFVF